LIEHFQSKAFNLLLKQGVENFVGVPDSTLKHFISEGLKNKKIIISTSFADIASNAPPTFKIEDSLILFLNCLLPDVIIHYFISSYKKYAMV